MSETLTVAEVVVVGELPQMPLVVVDSSFMSALASTEESIRNLIIKDVAGANAGSGLLAILTGAGSKLEQARKRIKEPFLEKCRQIDDAPKPVASRIEKAKDAIRDKLLCFQRSEERRRAEEERQRQAELARLAKLKREEDERLAKEAEKLAAELKASSPVPLEEDFEIEAAPKTEIAQKLEAAQFAPVPVAEKPQGVAFRCSLRIKSVQVSALPEHFIIRTADEKAIRSTFCSGWKDGNPLPVCPGVVFDIDRTPVSTGRTFA